MASVATDVTEANDDYMKLPDESSVPDSDMICTPDGVRVLWPMFVQHFDFRKLPCDVKTYGPRDLNTLLPNALCRS